APRSERKYSWPSSVGTSVRFRRRNSLTPRLSSSLRTSWLTAPGVTLSSPAAAFMLRSRDTASKARSAFKGGRRIMSHYRFSDPLPPDHLVCQRGDRSSDSTSIMASRGTRRMKTSDGISGVAALSGEEADSEFRLGWPVVLACFCMAVFSWGFGFYGQAVYLA